MRGVQYKDMAILYRTNAQSRIFEEKLKQKNIPYAIVRGISFYDRKEIKDLMSYLKVVDSGMDDLSASNSALYCVTSRICSKSSLISCSLAYSRNSSIISANL